MTRWLGLATALALVTATGRLDAQETYTIKFAKPTAGTVTVVDKQEKQDESNKITVLAQKMDKLEEKKNSAAVVYVETVLAVDKETSKPTKAKRTYKKLEIGRDGPPEKLGLEGKTVLIEKKGAEFQFSLEGGGEIAGKELDYLKKEFDKKEDKNDLLEKAMMPKGPVKAGESWKVPVKDLIRLFAEGEKGESMTFHEGDKSSAQGKLVKAYQKDGKQFGVVEYTIQLAMKEALGGGVTVPFQPDGKIILVVTYDGCIDGTAPVYNSTMAMKLHGVALFPVDTPQVRIEVAVNAQGKESRTPVSK